MSFLTARWEQLIVMNYSLEPNILEPFLPAGTELDLFEGKCYVSVVGFMVLDTKVMGLSIPVPKNFEEVTLRFYVKRMDGDDVKRGVVFVREIVPKPMITFVANTISKENYRTYKMGHGWQLKENHRQISYYWGDRDKRENAIKVTASLNSQAIRAGSLEEFILEHYWGYAHFNAQKTVEYEVKHPKWNHYPVEDYSINVNFEKVYGAEFGFLNDKGPDSVLLAEGSEISVESKRNLNLT
jgi:uncharacterized protein YqjF (DUF2071 family)